MKILKDKQKNQTFYLDKLKNQNSNLKVKLKNKKFLLKKIKMIKNQDINQNSEILQKSQLAN